MTIVHDSGGPVAFLPLSIEQLMEWEEQRAFAELLLEDHDTDHDQHMGRMLASVTHAIAFVYSLGKPMGVTVKWTRST